MKTNLQLTVRLARFEDAPLLWAWANDTTVRSNSFHSEPIPWDEHLRWYRDRINAPGSRFWLLEAGAEPVGQIRYDRVADGLSAELSYSVAPEHRGAGYGTELVRRTLRLACTELGVQEIIGIVLPENTASYRTLTKAGLGSSVQTIVGDRRVYRFTWRLLYESRHNS